MLLHSNVLLHVAFLCLLTVAIKLLVKEKAGSLTFSYCHDYNFKKYAYFVHYAEISRVKAVPINHKIDFSESKIY